MPGITLTADYGAGGSYIAPAVAQALGLPLLNRAINSSIAEALNVTEAEAQGGKFNKSLLDRFLETLAPLSGGVLGSNDMGPTVLPKAADAEVFRTKADAVMRKALASGAVIHGRGGAAAFRSQPDVFRVRLSGPVPARVAQGAHLEHMSLEESKKAQVQVDRARAAYVRRLYNVEMDDSRLYHLQLDSTALTLDDCVEVIIASYRLFSRAGEQKV